MRARAICRHLPLNLSHCVHVCGCVFVCVRGVSRLNKPQPNNQLWFSLLLSLCIVHMSSEGLVLHAGE